MRVIALRQALYTGKRTCHFFQAKVQSPGRPLLAKRSLSQHRSLSFVQTLPHLKKMSDEEEVLVSIENRVAVVTLNRPKVLNAVNQTIVESILTHIADWNLPDSEVDCIVLQGAGGRAFCSGGDVKNCVLSARSGDTAGPLAFFRAEYTANRVIAEAHVPYIALIDGIVMGGGVGLSVHGHFRVATERTLFAMPEVGIGLFPDTGASHFLHRLTGHLGRYLAITGGRLSGPEVKEAGIATHLIPSARIPEIARRLRALPPSRVADVSVVAGVLDELEEGYFQLFPTPQTDAVDLGLGVSSGSALSWKLPLINQHFCRDSVAEVVDSLEEACRRPSGDARADAFLQETLDLLRKASALSQRVAWEGLSRGRHSTLAATLETEYQLTHKFVYNQGDFWEGVRAVLIDKDNRPMWKYATARDVPDAVVAALFFPIPGVNLFSDTAPMPPVHRRHLHPIPAARTVSNHSSATVSHNNITRNDNATVSHPAAPTPTDNNNNGSNGASTSGGSSAGTTGGTNASASADAGAGAAAVPAAPSAIVLSAQRTAAVEAPWAEEVEAPDPKFIAAGAAWGQHHNAFYHRHRVAQQQRLASASVSSFGSMDSLSSGDEASGLPTGEAKRRVFGGLSTVAISAIVAAATSSGGDEGGSSQP